MRKNKPKYLSAERRELVLWALSLQLILDSNRQFFRGDELTWIDSAILSIEALSRAMLKGIDKSELRAIVNASKNIEPTLNCEKLVPSNSPTVKVNIDLLYDLAESGVELCKFDCPGDFENCPRRKMFLELLIPPWTTTGPCQYYRGEE